MIEERRTEKRNERTSALDEAGTEQVLQWMNAEDILVPQAVGAEIPAITALTDAVIQRLQAGGRLFYLGAGTSGRLGVLDAAECPPTFGVTPEMVRGLIAGGEKAIIEAVEGAEDSLTLAAEDLQREQLTANDVVVGIAASGSTPYVIGGLRYANSIGALTGSIACNKNAPMSAEADYPIEVETGSEILTGSTRLKAGTAQKLILNMISTASMVGLGKVYQNLMVDVIPTNEKLRQRSVTMICETTGADEKTARDTLEKASGHVKTAIVMLLGGTDDAKKAGAALTEQSGFVKRAIEELQSDS
ncbi:N-acetylmuramic acid 6-phosphate etherase [Salisediminibacterium halotolerans]|uniref:N-acetylmuramic acid 6-phosphate etherase n=1 Tax=Salisediminibacterium halotolerans TaxID=517425 RepID=A0A1H9TVC8_9BACI|nr:N-acetylmuramic acid 6-phosphate etherase [Salisediminibacterium haloalkalitolerans]SES01136.1 N-acetylmuramic acid 6-phosphate etherase [Salisediminibacterium haloalkalitolerans]